MPAESLDAGGWLLRGGVEALNDSLVDTWGNTDHTQTVDDYRAWLADQRFAAKACVVAVRDDPRETPDPARVLGFATLHLPLEDNTHAAEVGVAVRPSARRAGIGGSLHAAVLELAVLDQAVLDQAVLDRAQAAGRTHVIASTEHRVEPGPGPASLAPTTGEGLVDRDEPGVRFALTRHYALEQVGRYSVLDVPLDEAFLARLEADAAAVAGADYRLVLWEGPCPERWVDEFAALLAQMSTDAPHGELVIEREAWGAARVQAKQDELARSGRQYRATAAEHVPSGRLVAFTSFECPAHTPEYVDQDDTLVLPEHRGHRLGMLVKAVNLRRLIRDRPDVRRVGTWNAEENAQMLAINTALGFRAAGGSGEWQLRLG